MPQFLNKQGVALFFLNSKKRRGRDSYVSHRVLINYVYYGNEESFPTTLEKEI